MPVLKPRHCSGFTLIETMVAAVILGIAITGVMSMLPIGTGFERQDTLRRQASMIAANMLEQPQYHYSNYSALANPGTKFLSSYDTLKTQANDTVMAHLVLTAFPQADNYSFRDAEGGPFKLVPSKIVQVQINWTADSKPDSVFFQKYISGI